MEGNYNALRHSGLHLERHQTLARKRRTRARDASFVIFSVLVYLPNVEETLARQDIPRRQHRGHHGVILIVVFMHSVAADQMQAREALLEVAPDHRDVLAIDVIIYRIGLGLTHHATVDHIGRGDETNLGDLLGGERDKLRVGHRKRPSSSKQKYSSP